MNLFEVSIMTPDNVLFTGKNVREIVLPTTTGRMGILANHAPLVTGLDIGVLFISTETDPTWSKIVLNGGFALMKDNKVTIVVSDAQYGSDINAKEAEEAFFKAKVDLEKAQDRKETIEKVLLFRRARANYEACRTDA